MSTDKGFGPIHDRLNWVDAARLFAAFFIIAHHCARDAQGSLFPALSSSERVFPAIFRAVSELASTEFFFVIALLVLCIKLDRETISYRLQLTKQARRLLVPFLFWAVFYAFWRLVKASHEGYEDFIWQQLSQAGNWINYLVLGTSGDHMHFLPTLFLIICFYPLMRHGKRHPWLALLVIPALAMRVEWSASLWSLDDSDPMKHYLLRFIKVTTYVGYGFFAFAMVGLIERRLDDHSIKQIGFWSILLVTAILLIKIGFSFQWVESGYIKDRQGIEYWLHFLTPVAIILLFYGFQKGTFPPRLKRISKYCFGLYLIHPAMIDVAEILPLGQETWSTAAFISFKYVFATLTTAALVLIIARLSPLAWTIGLGKIPLIEKNKPS